MDLTPPEEFTVYHIGPRGSPIMKTKAVATYGITAFVCEDLLPKLLHVPLVEQLLGSGQAILSYMRLAKTCPPQPDLEACQTLLDHGLTHLRLAKAAGVPFGPKHHLFLHLLFRTASSGSPAGYSTFMDESLNRMMAQVSRAAHYQAVSYTHLTLPTIYSV